MCQASVDTTVGVNGNSTSGLKPQQIHLSFGDAVTSVNVMWATILEDRSVVTYHTGNLHDSRKTEGETLKLLKDNSAGAHYLHKVTLKNLIPGQKYFYHVQGESDGSISNQYSFTVPRELA